MTEFNQKKYNELSFDDLALTLDQKVMDGEYVPFKYVGSGSISVINLRKLQNMNAVFLNKENFDTFCNRSSTRKSLNLSRSQAISETMEHLVHMSGPRCSSIKAGIFLLNNRKSNNFLRNAAH